MSIKTIWLSALCVAGLLLAVTVPPIALAGADGDEILARLKAEVWQAAGRVRNWEQVPGADDPSDFAALSTKQMVAAAPTSAATLGDWTRIAFYSYRDGNAEIYMARGDGSQPVRVTDHPKTDASPRYSPNLARIAFVSNRDGNYEIYTMTSSGADVRRLTWHTTDDADPAWSPDGSRIAFSYRKDDGWEIYVMAADGSGQRRLTYGGGDNTGPVWSPDGSRIAWVRSSGANGAIWMMNADGSDARPLKSSLRYLENLAWSPDGASIGFDYDADGDYWNEIGCLNLAGTYTHTIYDPGQAGFDAWMGSWSPDNGSAMFTLVAYSQSGGQIYLAGGMLATVPYWGGAATALPGSAADFSPHWIKSDFEAPVSQVAPLPAFVPAAGFRVTWGGTDAGGAGIATYDVEVRPAASGAWTPWRSEVATTSAFYTGSGGAQVAFRARARDQADNVEAWPASANGDTRTTLYAAAVTGRVHDVRGYPAPAATVQFSPAALAAVTAAWTGDYRGYLAAQATATVAAQHAGYKTPPAAALDLAASAAAVADFALPDPEGYLAGGGFDGAALDPAWQGAGSSAPALVTASRHAGQGAIGLGQAFDLTPPEAVARGVLVALAAGREGTAHMVTATGAYDYSTGQIITTFAYTRKDGSGTWLPEPTMLFTTTDRINDLTTAADPAGGLHLLWAASREWDTVREVLHCIIPPSALACDQIEKVRRDNAILPAIALDDQGGLHAIWNENVTGYYAYRPAGGPWRPAERITADDGMMLDLRLAIDPAGLPHVVWSRVETEGGSTYRSLHTVRRPDGVWTPAEQITGGGTQWSNPWLAIAPDGTLHVTWRDLPSVGFSGIYYTTKTPGGQWTPSEHVPSTSIERMAFTAAAGGPQLVLWEQEAIRLFARAEGQGWRLVKAWSQAGMTPKAGATDPAGGLHFALEGPDDGVYPRRIYYLNSPVATALTTSSLAQRVTIPVGSHRPTLSFFVERDMFATADTLRVTADGGSGPQPLALTVSGEVWQHAWADLTPWAGKTVTLTFEAALAAGRPLSQVRLDDITIGPWLTPVITGLELPAASSRVATLRGENFVATPTVRIAQMSLTDVRFVDSRTLAVTLPTDLSIGTHILWVTNPGGQSAAAPVRVGRASFLPAMTR